MKTVVVLSSVLAGLTVCAAVPRVSNVKLTPYGKAKITYTLSEAPGIVTFDILTNGVSIGAQYLVNAVGDVNKVVQPGSRTIRWDARQKLPANFKAPNMTARVTVWPENAPPDYLAVDLTNADCPVTYYASEAALPWGKIDKNAKYKGDVLLMRKIHASHVLSLMGSPETEANRIAGRETRRFCTLTNDFYLAIYPTTCRQYALLNGSTSEELRLTPAFGVSYNMLRYAQNNADASPLPVNFPTTSRTFVGGSSYLKAWRDKTGLTLDLPTSAQWEFACRAGTDTPLYYGDGMMDNLSLICFPDGAGYEVGLYACNRWQMYDMIGNCYQWCLDYLEGDVAAISDAAATDPLGPTSEANITRKMRGYHVQNIHKRAAFFTGSNYLTTTGVNGFRLCITLP